MGGGSASFTVQVTFASLINLVNQFETKPKIAAKMVATLQDAQAFFANGNVKMGDSKLSSFIKQVSAESGKSLTTAQANLLIQYANTLMR